MIMGKWIFRPWWQAFKVDGRATRREYWLFYVQLAIVFTGLIVAASALTDLGRGPMSGAAMAVLIGFYFYTFVATVTASVRRLHDHDKSGWFYLLAMIPLIGWIFFLIMMLTPGTPGENNYGPDPREGDGLAAEDVGKVFS
jgi:uncharacterized membrane protein YhaH (DUF805 family)